MENGSRNKQKERKANVTKLTAQGYELLPPGRHVLEVVEAKPVNEYGPQLEVRNRVAEGEYEGFEFTDYPNRGVEDGVKVATKAWDIFEACLDRPLAPTRNWTPRTSAARGTRRWWSLRRRARATAPSTAP